MFEVRISLPDRLKRELAEAAREEGRTEAELVRESVEWLLRSKRERPGIPFFARRIGPLALKRHRESTGDQSGGPAT